MVSRCHPVEAVPLQENGLPVQFGGPTVGQETIVIIPTESPRDHILWSLFCFVYYNPLCLSLGALIFSIKARDRKLAGDLKSARRYGSIALFLNICTTVLVVLGMVIFLAMLIYSPTGAWGIYGVYNSYRKNYKLSL